MFLIRLGAGFSTFAPRFTYHAGREEAARLSHGGAALAPYIVFLALAALVVGLLIFAALTYLSTRGVFMYLHCIANDTHDLGAAWREHALPARSLFIWKLIFIPVSIFVMGVTAAIPILVVGTGVKGTDPGFAHLLVMGAFMLLVFLMLIAWILALAVVNDFVAPIMFLSGNGIMESIRTIAPRLKSHAGALAGYYLMKIALFAVVIVILTVGSLLTCCILGLILSIPVISQAILQPVHLLFRTWSLHLLANIDPEFDIFRPGEPIS